jgi:molecular chaperone DnaK
VPYDLAIDVGTTWTAAAIARDGRVETVQLGTRRQAIPSVVCLTDERLLVGEPAARRAVSDPQRVAREFKRRVGDPTPLLLGGTPMSAELCMARVASWVVEQVAGTEGAPPRSLAMTHPANWGEYKLDLLRQALRHEGLDADHLVPEPVAAATAYAAERALVPGSVVAVYDLGGGTFDAAVVRAGDTPSDAEIVGRPDGIERLGGTDFDHAVFHHVATNVGLDPDHLPADDPSLTSALVQLRAACVEAKEALSEETHVSIPVMLPGLHTEVLLTRRELEEMIGPSLEETIVALRRTLSSAHVADDDVAAVLLVGGSSRIPLVGQLVGARLGRPIAVDARPKDTICAGAARIAHAAATLAAARAADTPAAATAPPAAASPGAAEPRPTAAVSPAPATPPRGPDDDHDDHGARVRRRVAATLGAVIVVAVAVGGTLLLTDGSDGGGEAGSTTTTARTGTTEATGTTEPTETTAGGDGEADIEPLPGDDWNDAARARFVSDCTTHLSGELRLGGSDPTEACGCMYDDAAADPEWTFESFSAAWAADEIESVDSADLSRLSSLILQCGGTGR